MREAAAASLVLIAVAIGGATAAGAALRVPGTALRFGAPIGSLDTTFAAGPAAADTLIQSRRGPVIWFGVHATVTLSFREGRLAEAAFEADSTSPATRAYIEDELAREGYRRRCTRWDPDAHVCDWSGRAEIHLDLSPRSLRATMKEATPAPVAAVPALPAPARTVAPERTGPMTARDMEALARRAAQPPTPTPKPSGAGAPRNIAAARETVEADLPVDEITAMTHGADGDPVLVDSCDAIRPEAARRAGIFGTVFVRIQVDSTGLVSGAAVTRGIPELNRAALACARRYRFAPPLRAGRPYAFDRVVSIRFTK